MMSALVALLPVVGGVAVGLTTRTSSDPWYRGLAKPSWTPPGWAFPVAWTTLYLLMGVALARLVRRRAWAAVALFAAQLLVNYAWTPVFFGWRAVGPALAVIATLDVLVLATVRAAYRVDRASAYLLLPYVAWLALATALNASIWSMNHKGPSGA